MDHDDEVAMPADQQSVARRRMRVAGQGHRPTAARLARTSARPAWVGPLKYQLLAALVVQALIAYVDLAEYADDIPAALAVLYWTLSALVTGVALVGVQFRKGWWAPPLLIAEALIALGALYVLWVDYTSPYADSFVRFVSYLFLGTALLSVLPLGIRLTQLPGKAWAGGLAALSAFGLTQFVVENQILPNRQRPSVDVQVALSEGARSGHFSTLKGTVTFKNEGKATAAVVNGFLELRATDDSARAEAPLDPQQVVATFDPVRYDYQPYRRSLPGPATAGVIWLDELSVAGSFLQPGVVIRREFTVRVDRRQATQFELRASLDMFTNARLDPNELRTCNGVAATDPGFVSAARVLTPDVSGGQTTCFSWPIKPRNTIRALVGDGPELEFGYDFPGNGDQSAAWLAEPSAEDALHDARGQVRAANRIDRQNPGEQLTTSAALAVAP